LPTFTRVFDAPITRANEKHATADEVSLGAARSNELRSLINSFVLRRDARVNEKFLPELFVYAVFCKPSGIQISFMNQVIKSRWTSDIFARDDALVLIGDLRKIANHPCLYDETADAFDNISSGKMATLVELLKKIIFQMNERAVIVAQSTKMLDVIENVCKRMDITLARLDGSTPVTRRQEIVNSFNMYNVGQVFLLSTTAGGTGLNLIGSNRLIMYDLSWNPASDSQAMARIWRDGQTKPCYIYRLITTGSVEEKIYQRQLLKGEIAKVTVDQDVDFKTGASSSNKDSTKTGGLFSKEELRELFNLKVGTPCLTSEMMKKSGQEYNDVSQSCNDTVLRETSIQSETITFVYSETERKGRDCSSKDVEIQQDDEKKQTADHCPGDKQEDCISDLSIPDDFF
jgi:DNA repair and recombination protein RAD54B